MSSKSSKSLTTLDPCHMRYWSIVAVKVERGKSPDPRSSPENRAKAPEPQAVVTATNEQAHRAPDDARVSHAAKPVVKPAVHTSENAVVASTSKRVSEVSVPTGTSISRSGVAQPHVGLLLISSINFSAHTIYRIMQTRLPPNVSSILSPV